MKRTLIVNADDFGLSAGVNRGIIDCHEQGIVSSASLMVRGPSAPEAAEWSRETSRFSVGLHVDLAEWVFCDDEWRVAYEVVPLEDENAVKNEALRQLDLFRELTGKNPTHLDSHQHMHRDEPLHSILVKFSIDLSIPLRSYSDRIQYCGSFYGQSAKGGPYPEGIQLSHLLQVITDLPPGVTEMGCHPGLGNDVDSVYRFERKEEVSILCDPAVRLALKENQIELRSFFDFADC